VAVKIKSVQKYDTFQITSGSIACSDPCYDYPSVVVSAKNGEWMAKIDKKDCDSWGCRVARLLVHHPDFSPVGKRYEIDRTVIGVDSGQAGMFDLSVYGQEDFYDKCCSATLREQGFDVVRKGFVTSSGYGDGGYDCVIYKQGGKAVAIEVTFIPEE
jgi:hypothetical protein